LCAVSIQVATRTRVFFLRARTHGDMVNWIRELRRYTAHEEENDVSRISVAVLVCDLLQRCDLLLYCSIRYLFLLVDDCRCDS
jgi:hypothetical protein